MSEKRQRRETSPGKEKKRPRVCFVGGLDIELWEIVFAFLPKGHRVPFGMTCRGWYDIMRRAIAAEDWVDLILGSPWSEDDPNKLVQTLQGCIGPLSLRFERRAKGRILDHIAALWKENDGEWYMDDVEKWYDDPDDEKDDDREAHGHSGYYSTHGYVVPFIESALVNRSCMTLCDHMTICDGMKKVLHHTRSVIGVTKRIGFSTPFGLSLFTDHIVADGETKDSLSATLDGYFSKVIGQVLYQRQFLPEKHAIRDISIHWGCHYAIRNFFMYTQLKIARVCHEMGRGGRRRRSNCRGKASFNPS